MKMSPPIGSLASFRRLRKTRASLISSPTRKAVALSQPSHVSPHYVQHLLQSGVILDIRETGHIKASERTFASFYLEPLQCIERCISIGLLTA